MGEKKRRNVAMRILNNIPLDERAAHAEAANAAMDEAMAAGAEPNAWLRETFEADLVYGVWQDNRAPLDVGVALLKGVDIVQRILDSGKAEAVSQARVRCTSIEEAEAMCITYGDGRKAAA